MQQERTYDQREELYRVRHDQERQARRTLHAQPRKPGGRGHDAVLKALKEGERKTTLVMQDGTEYKGVVVGFDKYTITLRLKQTAKMPENYRRVFYKHALESFFGDEPEQQ